MKKLYIFFMSLFSTFLLVSCGNVNNVYIETIASVHDGDTFRDSHHTQYRLYGVDTPEVSNQYKGFESTTGLEFQFGNLATMFVTKLILHKKVKVIRITTDPYGRTVARIIINGKDLSQELIKKGYARVAYLDVRKGSIYETHDYEYFKTILRLQRIARMNKVGFWNREKYFNVIFPKA